MYARLRVPSSLAVWRPTRTLHREIRIKDVPAAYRRLWATGVG